MEKFEAGKKYGCSSICDSNAVFKYTIIKRTAKTVTIENEFGETVRRKVDIYNGEEIIFPEGKYSMCPTLRASDLIVEKPMNVVYIDEWKKARLA